MPFSMRNSTSIARPILFLPSLYVFCNGEICMTFLITTVRMQMKEMIILLPIAFSGEQYPG